MFGYTLIKKVDLDRKDQEINILNKKLNNLEASQKQSEIFAKHDADALSKAYAEIQRLTEYANQMTAKHAEVVKAYRKIEGLLESL